MSSRRTRGTGVEKTLSLDEQYLRERAWNAKKACKMVKDSLRWRLENKPENICWEDIAQEATTEKIYRSDYFDKYERTVLVYCQEQMVWLIDFQQWNMSSISMKVTREIANVLQNYYTERLGPAILYTPPKIFESFYNLVKLFLEHKTYNKAKFVYSDDPESQQIMENLFDKDKLESSFGG
ncbi:hypothetical protein GIB67_037029 [Kingdonia uniflora]|uniref:CRAL-TRIO domain-containing protein n=1 Tax=Kingdonia uniflora TaxID=39325 RepID=A0A7J7LHG7_9MAGN|nr:hypothetical protein GIB67_037029 [Kingdonia uniflora]